MRAAYAVLLAGLFSLSAARAAQPSIVGDWFEDAFYGGSRVIALLHIKADGTFQGEYRTCLPHGVEDSTDAGQWSYADGGTRWITKSLDGVVDEYRIESNDGRLWIYTGAAGAGFVRYGAVRFKDVRVTADSKMPNCDLTS
jgi:hypothetical protein